MKRYYLLAFANFLAAIGGGAILSSGHESLKDSSLHNGPIVAFFVGTLIGLVFQLLVSERRSRSIAPWFSVAVGPASLMLAWFFKVYAVDERLRGAAAFFFVALLSVRYALWFFSRAMRAQTAGSTKHGIALIELGYYSGMVFGLVVQEVEKYGMLTALLVDAMLLPAAGLIDLANANGRKASENAPSDSREAEGSPHKDSGVRIVAKVPFDSSWYWRLTAAVVCLTIGFQAVAFSLNHQDEGLSSTYVFACFYSGVALAALFCKAFQIEFDWGAPNGKVTGNATICSERMGRLPKASFGMITLLAAASMVMAVLASGLGLEGGRLELPFLFAAAFIYQILVLSLLGRIGKETEFARHNEGIKLTYLILGVGTVMSVLLLSLSKHNHPACVIVTVVCSLVSLYSVSRRAVAHN
jgi:hypothetical protein